MTYTYVLMDVSQDTYYEIYDKLSEAGYDHCFHSDDGHIVLDLHGIALKKKLPEDGRQRKVDSEIAVQVLELPLLR